MQNHLTGLARTWYDNLTYSYTWEEKKTSLIRILPDYDFASTLRQLVDQVQQPNETMTQYYFGKLDLLQECSDVEIRDEYCRTMGIQVHYNATATPRANGGQAERFDLVEVGAYGRPVRRILYSEY
jgi:hypothetical protein